jgi:hypothetical protein
MCGTRTSLDPDKKAILIHNDGNKAVYGPDSYLTTANSQWIAHTERWRLHVGDKTGPLHDATPHHSGRAISNDTGEGMTFITRYLGALRH